MSAGTSAEGRGVGGKGRSRRVEPPITSVDVPEGTKAVMVFGGTFDPPHFYHTVGPLMACMRLLPEASWLLYVPAARNPLKANSPVASDDDRVAMLKLRLDVPFRRSIWTDEIDRARWLRERGRDAPSYTIDTLRRLRRALKKSLGAVAGAKVKLVLLIGVDQAVSFHKWKDAREILKLAEIVVMPRAAAPTAHKRWEQEIETPMHLYREMKETDAWTREELAAWCRRLAPIPALPVSSSEVRAAIPTARRNPDSWERSPVLSAIGIDVARYIAKRGLYGFPRRPRKSG